MNQPTNSHELAIDRIHAEAERARGFRLSASHLDCLAEMAEFEARNEARDDNAGQASTERRLAAGYHESARALREAAKGGGS